MSENEGTTSFLDRVRWALVTAGGLGHLRPAPGTWGSIPPVVLAAALLLLTTGSVQYHLILLGVFLLFCLACLAWGQWAEGRFGRKDPRHVVADEVAGQCVALAAPPAIAEPLTLDGGLTIVAYCSAAFLLFRIFDIIKPPPAHSLQRLKGGAGILVDDLLAGLFALGVIQGVMYLLR